MYIKTKDGMYDTSKGLYTPSIKMYAIGIKTIYEDDIINQSENLAELCDCIIETKGHTGDYFHYTYTAFDEPSKERLLDDMINQDFEVYYAIWTSKGLIFVAKMNENGELELI